MMKICYFLSYHSTFQGLTEAVLREVRQVRESLRPLHQFQKSLIFSEAFFVRWSLGNKRFSEV